MANILVPINGSRAELNGFIANVSAVIDAGNDVTFVSRENTSEKVECSRIQVDAAGYVSIWGSAYNKVDRKRVYLEAGGWHVMPGIYGIAQDDTQTGLGIHVKI